MWGCRGRDHMVVGFTTTYTISAYKYKININYFQMQLIHVYQVFPKKKSAIASDTYYKQGNQYIK